MASTSSPTLHAEPLSDFILIRTDEVREQDRLRPVDPIWAKALGQIMLREGQDTPIQVCRLPGQNSWTLVAGAHRLAGAIAADLEYLRAEVVSGDRDERRLREVRENLWRSDLAPIDRAAFIAEAVSIYKRRAGINPTAEGRAASASARWQKAVKTEASDANDTMSFVYGWSTEIADQIGLNKRTIERDLMLYRRLAPSLVERLREARHPILTNATQLRALAKLEPAVQADVLDALVGDGWEPCKTVAEAVSRTQPAKPGKNIDLAGKRLSTFIDTFSRMTLVEKKGALEMLRDMLPPGTTLTNVERKPVQATFSADHVKYRDEALEAIDIMRDLVEGLLEDEIVSGERDGDLRRASGALQIARFTIAGNGFELGVAA